MAKVKFYLKQLFIEDINLLYLGTAVFSALVCFSLGIFIPEINIFIWPLALVLFFIGLLGPFVLVWYLIRKFKHPGIDFRKWKYLKSIIFGIYLGFLISTFLTTWDEYERQKSGQLITAALANFNYEEGRYPHDLVEIRGKVIDLPLLYPLDRFSYAIKSDGTYTLDIPVPITDRYHWSHEKNIFEYQDF